MATKKSLPDFDYRDRVGDGRKAELDAFAEKVGIKPIKDYNLFNRAFSHKSFTNEQGWSHNEQYEKLEFFGDSVLGLVINEYLFKSFPDYEEGDLSKIKSACVSEPTLAEAARKIDLGALILIGRGETRGAGTERPSLLADVFEAVIGAIYLEQGLPTARKFVLASLKDNVHELSDEDATGDHKSYFQEIVQKDRGLRPQYSVMKSSGPDHSRKFKISVSIGGKRWGIGEGKSKKEAEQDAAEKGLLAWTEARKAPKGRGRREGGRDGDRDRGRREDGALRPEPRREPHAGSETPGTGGFGARENGRRRPRGARARQMMRSGPRHEAPFEAALPEGFDPVAAAAGALDYPFRRRPSFDPVRPSTSSEAPGGEEVARTPAASGPEGSGVPRESALGGEPGSERRRRRRGRRGGRRRRDRDERAVQSGVESVASAGPAFPNDSLAATSDDERVRPDDAGSRRTEGTRGDADAGQSTDAPRFHRDDTPDRAERTTEDPLKTAANESDDDDAAGAVPRGRRRRGGQGGKGRANAAPAKPGRQAAAKSRGKAAAAPKARDVAKREVAPSTGRGRAAQAKSGSRRGKAGATASEPKPKPKAEESGKRSTPADDPIAWAAGESFTRRPGRSRGRK